jgi:hypothetical protein
MMEITVARIFLSSEKKRLAIRFRQPMTSSTPDWYYLKRRKICVSVSKERKTDFQEENLKGCQNILGLRENSLIAL